MKLLQHSNLHQFYLQLIHEGREKFGAPVFFIFFLLFSAQLSLGLKCSGEGETVLTNRDGYVLCGWSITGLSLCSTLINMIMWISCRYVLHAEIDGRLCGCGAEVLSSPFTTLLLRPTTRRRRMTTALHGSHIKSIWSHYGLHTWFGIQICSPLLMVNKVWNIKWHAIVGGTLLICVRKWLCVCGYS